VKAIAAPGLEPLIQRATIWAAGQSP